jgi:hypothetical protein
MKVQGNVTTRGEEPPMFLQRPSTGKSQDVRHILTRMKRIVHSNPVISNLNKSFSWIPRSKKWPIHNN